MMKRILLAAILSLPIVGTASSGNDGDPYPTCYPCPPVPPSAERAVVLLQSDAR